MPGSAIGIAAVLSIFAAPEKCSITHTLPGMSPNEVVIVIDGQLAPGPETIAQHSVYALEVRCWHPESDEIRAEKGVAFVHVVTQARVTEALASLESFATAYAGFHAKSSVRLESAEQLVPHGLAVPQRFDYSISDSGASVSVSDSRDVYRCTSALDQMDAAADCAVEFTGARRSLRAAWEGISPAPG